MGIIRYLLSGEYPCSLFLGSTRYDNFAQFEKILIEHALKKY